MNPESDAALLRLFIEKENGFAAEEAFQHLVERHGGMVHGVCQRILSCHADAEEATQATFVALALKARKIDATDGSLGGWLHHVARQISRDLLRSRLRREARQIEAARQWPLEDSPKPLHDVIDEAIATLPSKLKAAVIGHYLEGASMEELALRLGCSQSAVSMRLARGRERLREKLGGRSAALGSATLAALASLATRPFPAEAATATVRSVSIALKGTSAATGAALPLLSLAKEALWRMTVARLKWLGLAGGAAASIAVICAQIALPPESLAMTAPTTPQAEATPPASEHESVPWPALFRNRLRPVVEKSESDHPLIAAFKGNASPWDNAPAFKRLVESSGDLNSIRDEDGRTPLHWAVIRRWDDCALFFLLRGADVNAADRFGMTPLFYAVGTGDDETQQILILRGADLNHRSSDGGTPLAAAAALAAQKAVDLLLWAGARPQQPGVPYDRQPFALAKSESSEAVRQLFEEALNNAPNLKTAPRSIPTFVKNALHEAARVADFDKLNAFLQSGAPIDLPDDKGRTPLIQAILASQEDVVFYLLMLGANPNIADKNGSTPLMTTMWWLGGPYECERRNLLACNANPFTIRKDGFNELTWALERDNGNAAKWFLMLGADGRQMTKRGTPFQIAFKAGREEMMNLLRQFGIEEPVQWSDDPGWNLHNSVRRGDTQGVKEWLAQGVDINVPDEEGHSPLIIAIATRHEAIADLLIQQGADINYRNAKNGATAMYMTMIWNYHGMTEFRERLFEAGAEVDVPMGKGLETPLMRAVWKEPTKPLEQILEFGADINARNAAGLTPVGIAMKKGYHKTAEYLRTRGGHE